MADWIEDLGTADGIAGNSVKLILDGVPVLALQNFNWKIKKDKKPLFGAGYPQAHGVTRSIHKTYEIDFEVKEVLVNSAINAAQGAKNAGLLAPYEDWTDVRNGTIIVLYPGAAATRSKTFKGVEITGCDGGFADGEDADPIGMKMTGFATSASGLF